MQYPKGHKFPKGYFEDEVRDGFYVSGMVKRSWAVQLEVLEVVDKICKRHGLQYFAEGGTLLGAIRHGGFIPWDDDLDICMKREDYETFAQIALEELPEGYVMRNFEQSGKENYPFDNFLIRINNSRKIRTDEEFLERFHGFPYVAGVDIFSLDGVAPTEKADKRLLKEIETVSTLADAIDDMSPGEKNTYLLQTEKAFSVKFDRSSLLRPQFYMLADRLCGTYKEKDTKYLTNMAFRTLYDFKVPKEYYAEAISFPFEHIQIPVPVGYDGILRAKYGNYMEPVHSGGGHDYPFYLDQQEKLKNKGGFVFRGYEFSQEDMNRGERDMTDTLKSIALNMTELFRQAHESILSALSEGNTFAAAGLLADCQDGAIALGTKIEEVKKVSDVVGVLEQYCETLYTLNEAVAGGGVPDIQTAAGVLSESLEAIRKSVQENILKKRTVVFLPYKASMWDSLESVWKAADKDPDCDAYVIPIPYYDKNINGTLGEMHYEGEEYPGYVSVTDYRTFDFGIHHPDMIFIHNPYDEYNHATSVHPFFYSKNLKKFTDNLVYIPYFVLDEIEPDDERALKTMEHFCTSPAVIHADTVIVQSDQMRQAYIRALVDFAGEKSRPVWEKKILGMGSPKYDRVLEEMADIEIPEEWKKIIYRKDGTKKNVIFYNTGLGAMLDHNEVMLDKIENVLETFYDNREDVVLLWRPHPLMKATLQSMRPKLLERYEKLVENYRKENWGIYDDTPELDRAVKISAAYYGDPSSVVQLFKRLNKKAVIQFTGN